MTSGRDGAAPGKIGGLVGDLVGTLSGQNADRHLVGQCLDQLQDVLETLGEGAAAMSVRERLAEAGSLDHSPSPGAVFR